MTTPPGNQQYPPQYPYPQPQQAQQPHPPYVQPPYARTPYAQQPYAAQAPYAQAPYGHAPGPQPQPAPYGQQPPYAQQPPYGQQPYGQQPYGQAPRPRVPRPAGEARRGIAVTLDFFLAAGGPYVMARGHEGRPLTALALLIGVSFVNQVVLTFLFRASVGKLITGIRVIRASDGGRPGFWRTVYRWLCGMCWLPLQPYYWVRALFRELGRGGTARGTVRDNDDGELYHADLAGLRYARRRDLAA
ncbi:RDD family protein [Streptomyces sp. NPDC059851]|uniref:RDD family protein n=1 Tax=Streptomyces sp. NPDC059851 TaxID=3346971 RepID=UPI0036670AF6